MQSDTELIDEVVVVAYGTQKKSSFTGAASTVGAKSIEKRAITNVTAALEGNASGVQVTAATDNLVNLLLSVFVGLAQSMHPMLLYM